MNLTPEEIALGQDNFHEAVGHTRRDFLKNSIAATATAGVGLGSLYFGYGSYVDDQVRIGVIGTGDEGNVLIGAMNKQYVNVVAICDIRPYNVHRAFNGDWSSERAWAARPGLVEVFDYPDEATARENVKVYEDYEDLLDDPDVEAVIIALPLHLHHTASIAAMRKGKHVLTEKLMGHDVGKCKDMARVADQTGLYLATGHQRHYSVLYDNAKHLIQWGLLGQLHFIRAQWHRGNLPGRDSWKQPLPGGEIALHPKSKQIEHFDKIAYELDRFQSKLKSFEDKGKHDEADKLRSKITQWAAWDSDQNVKAEDYGYVHETLANGYERSALEELCRWRLWQRTGAGLMAELGSHQLDAASIFISCLRDDGKKAHPLTVHAVGGRHIFPLDRHAGDHVYCTFEFPGPAYDFDFNVGYRYADQSTELPNPTAGVPGWDEDHSNRKIVVTYSSIMGNGYGGYGEEVMGTRGTLVIQREKEVMLFKDSASSTRISVKDDGGGPTMDTTETGVQESAAVSKAAMGPPSRGYREEIEHWAWCIRNQAPENQPRCHPEVALGDAVIALTATQAIENANQGEGGYIRFEEEWFDYRSDAVPFGDPPQESVTA